MRCPSGEIGRHKGFKIPRRSRRAGSIPASGTIKIKELRKATRNSGLFLLLKWRQSGDSDCVESTAS
ncbi:hypothetical protein AERO8C_20264 [Aeromonas veronii]|uniref:Uncharacterized protein n=1 Tax=Aeromonas veronii TaxID=654 RepID=A0A653L0W4_AERVE|nr:hypothetical protein AERO8C_20264 [Aeromonas veronii]